MTVPAEIVCKVRQLDNDVQSIYEMLAEIAATQRRHGNRFTELDIKLTEVDGKLTEVDGKLAGMDAKLDAILGLLGGTQLPDPH
jgi:septation ring formation regulator EzrA